MNKNVFAKDAGLKQSHDKNEENSNEIKTINRKINDLSKIILKASWQQGQEIKSCLSHVLSVMSSFYLWKDQALRKCPVDIFSEGASWRKGNVVFSYIILVSLDFLNTFWSSKKY